MAAIPGELGCPMPPAIDMVAFDNGGLGLSPELRSYQRVLTRFGDDYRRHGTPASAECLISWLDGWARTATATTLCLPLPAGPRFTAAHNQGYHHALAAVSITINYQKVADSPALDPQRRAAIDGWIAHLIDCNRAYVLNRSERSALGHNQALWGLLAVIAGAIAIHEVEDFSWGLARIDDVLSMIRPDGFLPAELGRGPVALQYHNYALQPLVHIAELARRNGIDLYASAGGALGRMARTTIAGFSDPAPFAAAAGADQDLSFLANPNHLAWLLLYQHHTGDRSVEPFLSTVPPSVEPMTGNPWLWLGRAD